MTLADIIINVKKAAKQNSPEILTAIGVGGVVSTAYLTAKASFQACDVLRATESESVAHFYPPQDETKKERVTRRTKMLWRFYIPPACAGAVTVACVIGASKAHTSRTAVAVTAYSLTERAFSEYKEKVVEQLGDNKEKAIRDEIAKEKVDASEGNREVIVINGGNVLCCELLTQRYFRCDMETLRKAQNDINARIMSDLYVTLDEFYDLIGLEHTSQSDLLGWNSDRLMSLEFSTVLNANGEPCLAFEYNYTKPL